MRALALTLVLVISACERDAAPPRDASTDLGPRDVVDDLADVTDVTDAPPKDAAFVLPPYQDPWACPLAPSRPPLDEPLDASQARALAVELEVPHAPRCGLAAQELRLRAHLPRARLRRVQGLVQRWA